MRQICSIKKRDFKCAYFPENATFCIRLKRHNLPHYAVTRSAPRDEEEMALKELPPDDDGFDIETVSF